MAKDCPEVTKKLGACVIKCGADQETDNGDDPWMRAERAGSEAGATEMLPTRGPTYNVDVVVDSLKTRALLDHGAQVSIVRRELLPKIREAQGWTQEQYQTWNLTLDR